MIELWRVQLDKVIDGHWIDPLLTCSVLFNPLQQAVGVAPVALCLQHHFGQRRWLRQTFLSRCTSFSLLRSSRVAAGVDHPGKTKQRFKPGWQKLVKEVRNVMDNKECRDDHPYDMVI